MKLYNRHHEGNAIRNGLSFEFRKTAVNQFVGDPWVHALTVFGIIFTLGNLTVWYRFYWRHREKKI